MKCQNLKVLHYLIIIKWSTGLIECLQNKKGLNICMCTTVNLVISSKI